MIVQTFVKLLVLTFFFRFNAKEMLSNVNNAKSSVQKGIRKQLVDEYPHIEDYIDQILPKKETLKIVKW